MVGMGGWVCMQLGEGKEGRVVCMGLRMRTIGQTGGSAGKRHERRRAWAFRLSLCHLDPSYNKAQLRHNGEILRWFNIVQSYMSEKRQYCCSSRCYLIGT